MRPIRLQLVSDNRVLAEALVQRLSGGPGEFVVDHRRSVDEALVGHLRAHRPDVLLVDARSVAGHWTVLVDRLVEAVPRVRVAVLSATATEDDAELAARRCLAAWLHPGVVVEQLVEVLREVADGGTVYPSVVLGGVLRRFADEARDTSHGVGLLPLLTERERDVLACLSEGWSGPEIAEHLDMAVGTVRTHISRIFRKLGVHSRLEAVRIARESELEVRSSTRRRSRSSVVPASTPLRGLPGPRGQAGSTARPSDRPTEYRG